MKRNQGDNCKEGSTVYSLLKIEAHSPSTSEMLVIGSNVRYYEDGKLKFEINDFIFIRV
jgi:hypothetical protein